MDSVHPISVDLVIKPVSVALGFEQGNNGFKEFCEPQKGSYSHFTSSNCPIPFLTQAPSLCFNGQLS